MTHAAPTFIGFHGTSSVHVPAIRQAIRPPAGLNFNGRAQLGEGFYTTPDYPTALTFAHYATTDVGGRAVVVPIALHGFDTLRGLAVSRAIWWRVPAAYITDYDYLTAPIDGLESSTQLKVNPRAYAFVVVG